MTTWDEYIREMEQDLAERRKSLEPLKSGQMRLGERIGADPWIDITQREIDRREKTIAVYEALLVRLRAEREASRKHRLKDRNKFAEVTPRNFNPMWFRGLSHEARKAVNVAPREETSHCCAALRLSR